MHERNDPCLVCGGQLFQRVTGHMVVSLWAGSDPRTATQEGEMSVAISTV